MKKNIKNVLIVEIYKEYYIQLLYIYNNLI